MKKDYKLIARLAGEAFRIPIYVYENKDLIYCFPDQEEYLHPLNKDLEELWSRDFLSYTTNIHSIFVKLPCLEDDSLVFVCGPVSSFMYTPQILFQLHREYIISPDNRTTFDDYFCRIPTMTQGEFYRLMQIVYFMINDSEIEFKRFIPEIQPANDVQKQVARSLQAETLYQNKAFEVRNNSHEIEHLILDIVRRGDIQEMSDFISNIPPYHAGIVANDAIRMHKNHFITIISLITRTAISAGLPSDQAFGLSDMYITRLETFTSLEEINQLTTDAFLDFTTQVNEYLVNYLLPQEIDGIPSIVKDCMSYIKTHTNQKLSVESVAQELRYDRSYLSHLFSKTLGFSMSAYITRCKLEESKILLAYTNKSLHEIANYLCFSSQSHFQLRFRETFDLTPMQYRENERKQ